MTPAAEPAPDASTPTAHTPSRAVCCAAAASTWPASTCSASTSGAAVQPDHIHELQRLSTLLDAALAYFRDQVGKEATAEAKYRQARATAWVKAERESTTAREREDGVNAATAAERYERDLAAGMKQGALEAIRSRRQQISAWQSYMNANRAEAEFARTSPGGHL